MSEARESSEASLREFLSALTAADAAHAAVSAAALTGGLETSLLLMVATSPSRDQSPLRIAPRSSTRVTR